MCGVFVEIATEIAKTGRKQHFSVAFLYSLVPNIVIKYYLCDCECEYYWLLELNILFFVYKVRRIYFRES